MFRTIARYGSRNVEGATAGFIAAIKEGRGVEGPSIADFEKQFAEYHGVKHAVSGSYGRMAFYYILRALDFPKGSEIIFPALTFWVIPEIAVVAGLNPEFVDVCPDTYNMNWREIEPAITERTRAIVPTHIYGQPCDMDPILSIADRYNLTVIEDCAHALGATYCGRKAGTFGHAALFSFQMLKGLCTYGGGMAITDDDELGQKIRTVAEKEPWPAKGDVMKRIAMGHLQRALISPYGFTLGMFLPLYFASFFGHYDLSRFLWEKIRSLDPLPDLYRKRYSNAQAEMGMKMLAIIDSLNERSREHARQLTEGLQDLKSLKLPATIHDATNVYYQYCIQVSDPSTLSRRAIRKGIDVEIMHVDVCSKLEIFSRFAKSCPVAESTEGTLQIPVYSGLQPQDVQRIIRAIRDIAKDLPAIQDQKQVAVSA